MRKNIFEPLKMNNTYAIYHKEIIDKLKEYYDFLKEITDNIDK